MTVGAFLLGLVLLTGGAELLVRGATRLAAASGISPLVVGLTVVAFGTSAPELAVSLGAALRGQPDVALGNVIGSNIFNVLFILGVSAVITTLVVQAQLVQFDVPIMIAASAVALGLGLDGSFGRFDGALLFAGLIGYVVALARAARRAASASRESSEKTTRPGALARVTDLAGIGLGLGLLVVGSQLLLSAAVSFARTLGIGELVIGLTLVAAGTSLPEVATSVMAALRGERDLAVGNVVGSNIFNLLGVLGLSAALSPVPLQVADSALRFDLPVMLAVAVACLPIFFTEHRVSRWEGALLLGYYVAYTLYLVLAAQRHGATPWLAAGMLGFVVPLTVITLMVTVVRGYRRRRQAS